MIDIRGITESVLGPLDGDGYGTCPGAHLHSTPTRSTDYQVFFDGENGMPRDHCFHGSCAEARKEAMGEVWRRIRRAQAGEDTGAMTVRRITPRTAPQPVYEAPVFSRELAAEVAAMCPVDAPAGGWRAGLRAVSPVPIPEDPRAWPALLLDSIFEQGEAVLIFQEMMTQGDYGRVCGKATYRLGKTAGAKPCKLSIPKWEAKNWAFDGFPLDAGRDGMWFLAAPVCGEWRPMEHRTNRDGSQRLGRRHEGCCTRFPYAVIESDHVDEETWMRILVQLHDAIVAVYTSGSKSIHSLIRVGATTKEEFNRHRDRLRLRLVPLGADPAAITAVRLTRLPGAIRTLKDGSRHRQELLFLNPQATTRPIFEML